MRDQMECTAELSQNLKSQLEGDMDLACDLSVEMSIIQSHAGLEKERASFDMDITCADYARSGSGSDSMDLTHNLSLLPNQCSEKSVAMTGLPSRSVLMELDDTQDSLCGIDAHDKDVHVHEGASYKNVAVPAVSCMEMSIAEDRTRSADVTGKKVAVPAV